MKKTCKYIFLISGWIIGLFVAVISFILSIKMTNSIKDLNEFFEMINVTDYFLIFKILLPIAVLLSLTSIILHFALYKFPKANQLTQTIIAIINLALLITAIIYYVIIETINQTNTMDIINVELKDLPLIDYENTTYDMFTYLLSNKIVIMSMLSIVFLCGTSCLTLIYAFKKNSVENTPKSTRSTIQQEIEEMKQELELQQLKEEYLTLYEKIHKVNKNEKSSK